MDDLVANGCEILTLGQYLQPTSMHLDVQAFITPETFDMYKEEGLKRGFLYVESGPLVRSSYHAEKHVF
jgi:lipoic acid synthetase